MIDTKINLIVHNIRSAHNVGALLRTSEGLGVSRVYLTGYSPYPTNKADTRLPHIAKKVDAQIAKTALGAQNNTFWQQKDDVLGLIMSLRTDGWIIAGLEQNKYSVDLNRYRPPNKITLVVGNEISGIENDVLDLCDDLVEIPMFGKKESFNVVEAASMALYHCRFVG
jgi:tRNA G18 (ribose-2'-O)-methylase SpoU